MNAPVNPIVLTWARERTGLTVAKVARLLDREPQEIESWERGDTYPSYNTAEKLAYSVFKLPLAVLFFPKPPVIDDPVKRFRRLPDYEFARFSADTYHKIHLAQAYQDSLKELSPILSRGKRVFETISGKATTPASLAKQAREFLGATIEEQFNYERPDSAFKAWRRKIELAGVFSFKDSFHDDFISGLSLADADFPVVLINNSTAFARQIFTLAHELGHILYGMDGLTDIDETYIEMLPPRDKDLEVKCNAFAAEFLVPRDVFFSDIENLSCYDLKIITALSDRYSVSREVIARRLLDLGAIGNTEYLSFRRELNADYDRKYGKKPGGNFYLTKLSYLGESFARAGFEGHKTGRFTAEQLGRHLNMNAKNLAKLQSYLEY